MAVLRYAEEMKDSGIEYIGEIPAAWKTIKLKYAAKCLDGKRVPVDTTLRKTGPYPYWGAGKIMDYVDDYIFDEEIVLLGEDGAPFFDDFRPVSHYVNEKVWVNNHIHVLRALQGVDSKYLVHGLNCVDYHHYISGTILNKLTQGNMANIVLPLPPYTMQIQIVKYLDERCSKIDDIIEEAIASIEEYKELKQATISEAVTRGLDKGVSMKDSGIDWLPCIPEHWDVRRIASIYDESKETGRDDLPILLVSIHSGISDREIDDDERDRKVIRSEDKTVYKVVHKNYLAYNMMRAWQGGFGASLVDGLVSPAYVVAKPKINVNSSYIENVLRTPNAIEHIRGLSYGVADFRLRLYWPYFKTIRVPLPPIEEQNRIVAYIQNQKMKIDTLISEKQAFIEDLQAYKKSLIYEVVTGKRRVV